MWGCEKISIPRLLFHSVCFCFASTDLEFLEFGPREIDHRDSVIMVLQRIKQVAQHVSGTAPPPHPFDPLSASEIENAVAIVRKEHASLYFNAITTLEPRKAEMMAWLADPEHSPRPRRMADVVATGKGSKVYDGLIDLEAEKVIKWETIDGVQPIV